MDLEHIFKSVELIFPRFLCLSSNADEMEFIEAIVGEAFRLEGVGAIILIVWYFQEGWDLTTKIINPVYADVYDCLSIFHEIFTDHVASVAVISISSKFTVCVLGITKCTL